MNNLFRSSPVILKNIDLIWVRFYFDLRRGILFYSFNRTLKSLALNGDNSLK